MAQNAAHDAADTINMLAKAIIDAEIDYDISQAMSVRDNVRELGYDLEEPDRGRDLPSIGDVVIDTESPHWSDGRVEVTAVPACPAESYDIDKDAGLESLFPPSVADENPGHPDDAPVVVGRYIRDNGGVSDEYAFPATRLEW